MERQENPQVARYRQVWQRWQRSISAKRIALLVIDCETDDIEPEAPKALQKLDDKRFIRAVRARDAKLYAVHGPHRGRPCRLWPRRLRVWPVV